MWHLLSGCDQSPFYMLKFHMMQVTKLCLAIYSSGFINVVRIYYLRVSAGKIFHWALFLLGSLKYILFNTIKHKNSNKSNYKIVFSNLELFNCMHIYVHVYMYIFTLWLENCMVSFIIKPCKQTFLFFNHKSTSGNFRWHNSVFRC